MAKLKHQVEYLLVKLAEAVANLFSAKTTDRLAVWLGRFGFRILPSRRKIAIDNLSHAFGDTKSSDEINEIARRVFENVVRSLFEVARFGRLDENFLHESVVGDDVDHVRKVCEKGGGGGIVLTAHFGNWELLGIWLLSKRVDMDYVVATQHNEKVDALITKWHKEMGAGIIALPKNTRQVFKSIKSNRVLAMSSDQHAPNGIVMDFFGRPAATAKGVALFSIRTNCPIFPILVRRERYDRHVVMVGETIFPPNTGNEEEDIRTITRAHTDFLEKMISKYPDQWLWTHRRWKLPSDRMQPA